MRGHSFLELFALLASKSLLLKKLGNKLAPYMLPDEIETKVCNARFLFRPKEDGLWYLNYSHAEPGMAKVLSENLKGGDTFIDVGAYIGYYSILARIIVGESGKVVSFEPNPESYEILRRNIELNRYANVVAENVALSDEEGTLKLFIGRATKDSSSLFLAEEVDEERYVTVKVTTLDNYCQSHGIAPNFVKIDAEGAEYKILKGFEKTINAYHPKLVIEIHPKHLERQGVSLCTLFEFLKSKGYEVLLVREEGIELIPEEKLVSLCKLGRKNKYGTMINQVVFCRPSVKS
jgi:FkbM family methyltransferase